MKSQVALEYMIIVAVVLAVIIPVAAFIYQQNETATRLRQAEIAVNMLASSIDNLYAQGPGAKTTVNIYLPSGYSEGNILEKKIILKIYTPSGYSDVISKTKANLTGSLPQTSGYKLVELELLGNGFVNISG